MKKFTESQVEEAAIEWFEELGYSYLAGPDIAFDGENPMRQDYKDVILEDKLEDSLKKINPTIPLSSIKEAIKKLKIQSSPSLTINNKIFHKYITDGVDVEYKDKNRIKGDKVWLFDKKNLKNNDFCVVNQFTIVEKNNRRPDLIVFVNGLPIVVIEFKNATDEKSDIKSAYNQIQTYKNDIPTIFSYNAFTIISDGTFARAGTITADFDRFMSWKTIDGENITNDFMQLETQIKGMFDREKLLEIIHHFILFQDDGESIKKILAAYHQYYATQKAVEKTKLATSSSGTKKIGVVWHTTGSGKSLTMTFYTGKIILELDNPTIVVLTDRNDLDEQLYNTFSLSSDLLRQIPQQAKSRTNLRELLSVESGGIIFTTIQKFMPDEKGDTYPQLSNRRNIVVIADEAHRTQYDLIDGFAKNIRDALPNASFIGFTGTPIEGTDINTPAIFGDYIDVYDMTQSIQDKATVPIYYECRLAKIGLLKDQIPKIEEDFEELTESQELDSKQKLKSKWSRLEALVGSNKRLKLVAKDILKHFDRRREDTGGKAMIVCMSRKICVELYDEIIKLKPEWHNEDNKKGKIKVIMSGSAADPQFMQDHIRNKEGREEIGKRLKNPKDELEIVIVRDMWLTGFDAPCIDTMYVDKPMKGHNLIQAISRVNRVFRNKSAGLIVDYLGIGDMLKKALGIYTQKDRQNIGIDTTEAIALMLEEHEILKEMFHGFDYKKYFKLKKSSELLQFLGQSANFILGVDKDSKKRYLRHTIRLKKAHSLCASSDEALNIAKEIEFMLGVRAILLKFDKHETGEKSLSTIDENLNQLISKAITSEEVVDIFAIAGIDKPDISILSDEFLQDVKSMSYKNLALELLQKLLNDEIKSKLRKNIVMEKKFSEMLEEAIMKYQNKTIETAKVIAELIEIAKQVREAHKRGEKLGLNEDELAFYEALEINDSAVKVMGDEILKTIALELTKTIRDSLTIDWDKKESVRAKMRVYIRRILRKYGYPPDLEKMAVETVMKQAERSCNYIYEESQEDLSSVSTYPSFTETTPMAVAEEKGKYKKK